MTNFYQSKKTTKQSQQLGAKPGLKRIINETRERLEDLKSFLAKNAGHFLQNDELKSYLQLPHINFTKKVEENKLLEKVVSDEYFDQIYSETEQEIDKIIFFIGRVSSHKSFLTRIYEFYIKYNESADKQLHEYFFFKKKNHGTGQTKFELYSRRKKRT